MQICYDSQTFLRQRSGGVSRLFSDLIHFFDLNPSLGIKTEIDLPKSHNQYAVEKLETHGVRLAGPKVPRHLLYAQSVFRKSSDFGKTKIIHHTYYDKRFLSRFAGLKRVVTVYDMIPELFRGQIPKHVSHLDKQDYVELADSIICISSSTRDDLLQTYSRISAPITIIPLAVDPRFAPGIEKTVDTPRDYALYVGGRENYKDFDVLLQALSILKNRGNEIPLVAVGAKPSRFELSTIKQMDLDELVLFPSVSDSQLPSLYSNALVLVQSSRYEGFGLTPLEAMASGIPAIAANSSSMPEVGGEVVQYFAPQNSEELAHQISRVLGDSDLHNSLSSLGLERSAEFSLERMAKSTADVYRKLGGGRES